MKCFTPLRLLQNQIIKLTNTMNLQTFTYEMIPRNAKNGSNLLPFIFSSKKCFQVFLPLIILQLENFSHFKPLFLLDLDMRGNLKT